MEFYIGKGFPDNEYGEAQIIELKMQKRFRAKDQNKDDVLQEDLYNGSECTTDDETEEQKMCKLYSLLQCYSKNTTCCKCFLPQHTYTQSI